PAAQLLHGAVVTSSFPGSAWERTLARLCLATPERGRASQPCVPRRSLGTRDEGINPMDAVARVFRLVFVGNWHLTLALALGLAALCGLLPRVQPSPPILGATLGGLALLLASVLLVRADVFQPEAFLFYAFSAIAVVGGALLVTQSNPVYAALSFVLVVLSTC